jgi:mannose-6-phosphate isomerase
MWQLTSAVRCYPWGSRTVIPELLGQPVPAERPHAELWIGAHPDEPSRLADGRRLDAAIAADPERLIGRPVLDRFGPRLPFLLKVLAADRPLSLQAHPTTEQAKAGYAAEEAAGIPRDDPTRTFRDPHHKPELLVALTTFEALCGFRPVEESLRCLDGMRVPELQSTIDALARGGLRAVIPQLLGLGAQRVTELVAAVQQSAARSVASEHPEFVDTYRWAANLAEAYPGDPGVVLSLMCNHLTLEPGEAVFLPPGNLHTYLCGAGVEIMASSDNVLRGGLTAKHVNLTALVDVLDFSDGKIPVLHPVLGPGGLHYPVPVEDFRLIHTPLDSGTGSITTPGPQVVLCTEGRATLVGADGELALDRGQSAFIAAGLPVRAQGPAVLYRATTNLG